MWNRDLKRPQSSTLAGGTLLESGSPLPPVPQIHCPRVSLLLCAAPQPCSVQSLGLIETPSQPSSQFCLTKYSLLPVLSLRLTEVPGRCWLPVISKAKILSKLYASLVFVPKIWCLPWHTQMNCFCFFSFLLVRLWNCKAQKLFVFLSTAHRFSMMDRWVECNLF